jgi:hypothetical protein
MNVKVKLLTRVSLNPDDALLCQCPGCNRRIYADVHVLRLDGAVTVYGSSCYHKIFGDEGGEVLYPWTGERLTAEQRSLLEQNTEEFIARYLQQEDTQVITPAMRPQSGAGVRGVVSAEELKAVNGEYIAKAKDELRRRGGIDPNQPGWIGLVTLIAADMQAGRELDWSWLAVDMSQPTSKRKKPASADVTQKALADIFETLGGKQENQ